jgi:hypothetical protein
VSSRLSHRHWHLSPSQCKNHRPACRRSAESDWDNAEPPVLERRKTGVCSRRRIAGWRNQCSHAYCVSSAGILVHNGKTCSSHSKKLGADLIANGFAKPKGKYQAAHLVPTSRGWKKRSDEVRNAIHAAQEALGYKNGKLPAAIDTHVNEFWAKAGHAGTHTDTYFLALGKALNGKKGDDALKALDGIWKKVERGDFMKKVKK